VGFASFSDAQEHKKSPAARASTTVIKPARPRLLKPEARLKAGWGEQVVDMTVFRKVRMDEV
jgi:hypothetical protein